MATENRIVEQILAQRKAKEASNTPTIKPDKSLAEKIVAKDEQTSRDLMSKSLGALVNKTNMGLGALKETDARFNNDVEEMKSSASTLVPEDATPTPVMRSAERVTNKDVRDARAQGMQTYLDNTIGAWGEEKITKAEQTLRDDETKSLINTNFDLGTYNDEIKAVDLSFKGLGDTAKDEASKIVKDYLAENPHMEANAKMLESYVAGRIYNDTFKWKLENDIQFFADAFEAANGIKYEDYLRKEVNKAKSLIKELRDEAETEARETVHDNYSPTHYHGAGTIPHAANISGMAYGSGRGAAKPYNDLLEEIEKWEKNGFGSGFRASFDLGSMLSLGLVDIANERHLNDVLTRAYNGEELYGNDARLFELFKIQLELENIRDIIYEPQSRWSKVGEGIGTTVNMIPEFALAMTGTGMIGSFAKLGGKTALTAALKAGGKELFKYGVKTTGKLGYNYGLAKVRGFAAAPFMPSTYNTYLDNLNSAYKFDDEGNLTYTPVNKAQAAFGAAFSTANEISSEYLGVGIGKVVGWGARGLGRMVAGTKLAEAAVGVGEKVRKHLPKFTPQAKVAMRTLGVQADPVSETLSEALGDIMTSYEQTWIGMDVDKSQYGTMDYWMTLAGVTLIYGGSIAALGAVNSYRDVKKAVKAREDILEQITDRNLHDTLVAISTSDDVVMASAALADMNWDAFGDEAHLARAYVATDLNVKILEGAVEEESRLGRFRGTIEGVRNIVYQGKAGEYSDIIREAEMDGKKVYIINGYEANTNQYIVVDATTGEKTSVDKSKVTPTRELDVDTYIQEAYKNTFSLEAEKQRVADVKAKALQLDNPTEKDVARVASTLGIALPKVGNTLMLANGNMGAVTDVLSPTEYAVQDPSGATYKVHFTDILSTDKLTATAQGALARGEAARPIAPAPKVEAETTTETTTPDDNGINIGAEVTVDGRVGKVRARTQDGKYAVAFEAESGNYEDTEVEFFTGEELASLMGIAPAPTAEAPEVAETAPTEMATMEDGSVDIEQMSAEDAAKALIQRAGTIEEAIAQVKQVIETVAEERKKTAKAEKKTSLNDIGKKSAELQALDTRLEFFGEVLGVLEGMLAEQQEQTMTEAQNIAEETGAAPKTTEAIDTKAEQSKPVEQPTSGLIRNGAEMKFTDNVIKMVDFVAKRLGITVEFVDGLKNEAGQPINGDITGKRVRISTSGTKGIKFIMGHEFFHRMKDIVDEQTYTAFVESVKEYAGEKLWNATIAHQRNVYRNHNARVAKEAMAKMSIDDVARIAARLNVNIEGLSLEDAKDAVIDGAVMGKEKGVAEVNAIFPKMLSYNDTLMVEECAADVAGTLVTNTNAFAKYVEDNSSNIPLVRGLRKAIRAMREFFDSFGYTEQQRKFNALEKNLASVLNEAAKKEAKAKKKPTTDGETRNSIQEVEESAERLAEQGAVVNTESGDVRFALQDVLVGDAREQAIADLMRVTGRSRATVLKYLKAEESLAAIILDDDNQAFLDLQVDESVPSIWKNSDYPQGTVEFSNICRKRLPYTMIYQRLQKDFPNVVFDASALESIRQTMIANGEQVACALCFVEDRRQLMGEIGQSFIDALKGEEVDLNDKQKTALERLRKSGDTYIPSLFEITTLDGMKFLRKKHPEVASAFVAYNNARGMQAARLFQAYSAYHREILNFTEARVKKINKNGGLRIFSFSDFEAHHLIDLVQVLTDCAAKGVMVQGYTKVPEFANAVKETKMKLNRSLIGKSKGVVEADYVPQEGEAVSPNVVDGKRLLFDTVEGIDVTSKDFFDSTDSHNVGNILVTYNEEQTRIAMQDPFVDYIIPFHTGIRADILEQKGIGDWVNYKNYQSERVEKGGKLKKVNKGINIYTDVLSKDINTERQFVNKYLAVCKAKGYVPKFDMFLDKTKKGEYTYTKGYYKFLLDFKMFDKNGKILPQEVVVPVFDNEVNKQILEDYVADEKAKAPNDELYGKVVDAMVERGTLTEAQVAEAMEGVRFSLPVIQGLSDALNEYKVDGDIATFVEKVREVNDEVALGHPMITSKLDAYDDGDAEWFAEKIAELVGDFDGGYAPYTAGGVRYALSDEETAYSNVRYSITETDPTILDALNNGETMKVYRAMQVIDGELYPPMSAKVDGKLRNPIKIGVWERAEERPDLADEKGNFKLDKGNKTSLKARYNPYIHTSLTPLNDQFSSAQDRPNLVTVEVEVPVSELTSGYKAEKAKDAVGKLEWKAGVVQGQLTGTRTVILSRWDRPLRIVPDSEVAQRIVEMFGDTKVVMPSNVVTPSLRAELEKLGVPFRETTNQGKPRFSLPTDLLTDFADEFKALQDEYASLDPATIDYKHPFRVHKREVVQKYVDHVADVLGLPTESFAIDLDDDAQIRDAYYKYMRSHKDWAAQHSVSPDYMSLKDFTEELRAERPYGIYYPKTSFIVLCISETDGEDALFGWLGTMLHENTHKIIEDLGISDFEKELVYKEAQKNNPKATAKIDKGYHSRSIAERGEEIIAYAIEGRLKQGDVLLSCIEGKKDIKDVLDTYKINVPLRKQILKKVINTLKDGYERKQNATGSKAGKAQSMGFGGNTAGQTGNTGSLRRRGYGAEVARYHLPDPDPSDVFFDEIPIFDEQGNEVDITTLSSEEAKEILDGKVRQMLEAEYDHAVVAIRREAEEARQAVKEVYRAEKEKRRKGAKAARTNAARIDVIFGDTPFESLPYEVQALILIATGEAKIYWGDRGNKRGLASELGLTGSTGDRHAYRNIWGGAKKSFNEVVHDWWESIGGQERGIDDQDLRNVLISALQSVQSSKDAMQEIINKYDDLATDRDNTLAEIDRNEEKELYEAKTAYEQHLANFELSEGEERTAYHDRAAQFFGNQSLSRVDDILEDLTNELERSKRKIERLKAEKKDVYTPLAESIQHAKDTVLRALERLRMFAGMEEVDLNDVARLINLVKASRSQRQVEELGAQATALVQRVSIKKAKTNLMRLLSLKLSNTDIIHKMLKESDTWTKEEREAILKHLWKVSRNGLRVSKAVHKDTKEIVDELKSLVDAFRKNDLKGLNDAQKAKIIEAKLAEVEKELHPEVVYDSEGNVQDNADLPTDFNAENKHLAKFFFKSYIEMLAKEMEYHNAAAELREKIDNKEKTDGANAAVVVARENYLNALNQFNSSLESLILEGKDKLRDWNAQKEKHEIEMRSMGIRAIGGKKASGQGERNNWVTRQRARINTTVNAPYWTFETVLEKIDHNSPYKKGKLYTYFMDKWADANDDLINRYAAHMEEIAEIMRKCFPDDAKNILKLKRNPYALYQYIMRKAESTPIGTLTYKEMGENGQMRDAQIVLNVANAMYVIAMWRQPRYQEAMQEKHAITQGDIDALMANIASVNAGFLDFMDWVNETFLPSTRLEYDVVYRKMNGGSMPKEINYFPARVAGHKEVDLANIDNGALPTTPSALKDRMSAHIMPQLGMDYFKVLKSHIQDMDNWAAYAELTADLNVLLSSDEFRRRCNDYMGGLGGDGGGKGSLYDLFKQTSLIATGMYRGEAGHNQLLGQLQKAWATSNIAFRGWTAVKQISSITTGMFDNLRFYKHAGIAATGVGIYHEIKSAMEISPSLRYRWKSGAAGMEALARETQREDGYTVHRGAYEKGKDFIGDAVKTLVRAGMTPNAAVDLLACSIIVNSVYETEIARLTDGKREATEEEKRAAVRKAERAFNTTQQSSEGAYLSPVQANPAYGVLTTYMNASFALHRKRMGGIKELWKLMTSKQYKRYLKDEFGADAVKISAKDAFKDILSGVAGELSFAMMGWGLMEVMALVNGWLNDDDDDEDVAAAKQEVFDKWWKPILPMLNGYLFGSAATSWASGFDTSLTPAYDEFVKDVKGVFDDSGNRTWEVAQMAAKYFVGVDLKAMQSIGAGLEAMVEDDERAGAVLKFLNAPSRYIKAFVGDRREGETLEEYQTRIIRFHSLLEDVVYEHYFDEEGNYIGVDAPSLSMSKNQAQALRKEYEVAYAKNVLYHHGGKEMLANYMKVDKQYKDVCNLLGWKPDSKPSKKSIELSDMHAELAYYQYDVAYWTKRRKNWVGSEDYYYDLLMDEQKAKNDLINNYYEYIKQAGLGAY